MVAIPSFNLIVQACLVFIAGVWVKRVFWMRALGRSHPPLAPLAAPPSPAPLVSVIVPAKNEEKNIGRCLSSLFKQNYPPFEIIVVDDRSGDQTPHLLENFKKLSPVPFEIIRVEKLPAGWTGKNYAMFTGSKAAGGAWLLFTDADTTHSPESVGTAVACAAGRGIDLLTLAPQIESRGFWEKTVQPLAAGSLALWFDPRKINDPKSNVVLANGQFLLIRKGAYEKVGGNETVKDRVVEDVELARQFRSRGYLVQFLDGTRLYSTRMYGSLKEIRAGWTRILTYLFDKNIVLVLHKIFMFAFFSIFPFAALGWQGILGMTGYAALDAQVFWLSLVASLEIAAVRFVGNQRVRSSPWFGLLHPLGSLVMVWILLACAGKIVFNRSSAWRGDVYR